MSTGQKTLYTGKVKTQDGVLNVRQTPGGRIIGVLKGEAEVQVLGDEGEWVAIAYGEGMGYAAKRYIAYVSGAEDAARIVIEDEAGNVFIPQGGYTARLITGPID